VPQAGPRSSGPPSQVAPDAAAKKQEYFVLIDPGHGGADKGATLGSGISEKQVTLAFARELRKQLAERGIASHLLREADTPLSLEQRAEMANQQRPFLYLGIHASTGPKGVRVYAPRAQKPSSPAPAFLDWDAAQFPAMERSAGFARSVTRELQRREIHAVGLTAVLRPLNNVTAPAIGIEIAAPAVDAGTLLTQKVENPIATALATAVAQFRPGGARP
jgi:N-acetylmuramoyl-L-alanine amidase